MQLLLQYIYAAWRGSEPGTALLWATYGWTIFAGGFGRLASLWV
jgi:hypothetical protein